MPGHEAVAEQTARLLAQLPAPIGRPECGQLFAREPGPHTHPRVVPRDRVATNESEKARGRKRERGAARFAGHKHMGARSREGQQFAQPFRLKMMQEQIGQQPSGGRARLREPVEDIRLHHLHVPAQSLKRLPRFRADEVLAVHEQGVGSRFACGPACGETQQESSIARTKLEVMDPAAAGFTLSATHILDSTFLTFGIVSALSATDTVSATAGLESEEEDEADEDDSDDDEAVEDESDDDEADEDDGDGEADD